MKKNSAHIAIAVICIILGFSITLQIKSVKKNQSLDSVQNLRAEELQSRLIKEIETNQDLTKQINQNKDDLKAFQDKTAQNSDTGKVLNDQLVRAQILAGLVDVKGPGVTVTLDDSKIVNKDSAKTDDNYFIIHDDDILRVINELKAAGSEAISINGERFTANSEVRCAGSTISVNNNKYGTPFVITAIGDSKTLDSALNIRKGVVDILTSWGIEVTVKESNNLVVPRYNGVINYKYAQPVTKGGE